MCFLFFCDVTFPCVMLQTSPESESFLVSSSLCGRQIISVRPCHLRSFENTVSLQIAFLLLCVSFHLKWFVSCCLKIRGFSSLICYIPLQSPHSLPVPSPPLLFPQSTPQSLQNRAGLPGYQLSMAVKLRQD